MQKTVVKENGIYELKDPVTIACRTCLLSPVPIHRRDFSVTEAKRNVRGTFK